MPAGIMQTFIPINHLIF